MKGIKDKYARKWGLADDKWQEMSFTIVNPTNADATIDFFNPQIANTFNYPTQPTSISDLIPTIPVPITIAPDNGISLAYDTVNQKVYSGSKIGNLIFTYSDNPPQTSPAIFNSFNLVSQNNITAISFSETSIKIAVGSQLSNFLSIVDSTTNTLITDINLGFVGVSFIKWNPLNNTWIVSTLNNLVFIIDCVTNLIITSIPLGATVSPKGIAINVNNNTAYIVDTTFGNNQIFKINLLSNTVISTISTLGFILKPYAIEINNYNSKMYVGSNQNLGIWTFDINTDTFISNIEPTRLAVSFLVHPISNSIFAVGKDGAFMRLLRFNSSDVLEYSLNFNNTSDVAILAYSPIQNILYSSSDIIGTPRINSIIPSSSQTLYITGDTNYNFAVRDGFNSPFWVDRIYFYSQNTLNFNQTFFKVTKDANGNFEEEPNVPSLSVSMMQFQSGIGMVRYPNKSLVLGINQWFRNLLIKANSQLTIIFVYQQLEKSYLLSASKNADLYVDRDFDDSVNRKNPIQKFKLEDLNNIMPLNNGDYEIVPFSISNFNNILLNESKKLKDVSK